MTQHVAKIESSAVAQIILIPDEQVWRYKQFIGQDLGLGGTWQKCDPEVQVGWLYSGAGFAPPPEPEPEPARIYSVTRRQARLALLQAGRLDAVEQAIEQAGRAAQIEYEADTWDRDNAFLQQLWTELGGTEQELDDLFTLAAGL